MSKRADLIKKIKNIEVEISKIIDDKKFKIE